MTLHFENEMNCVDGAVLHRLVHNSHFGCVFLTAFHTRYFVFIFAFILTNQNRIVLDDFFLYKREIQKNHNKLKNYVKINNERKKNNCNHKTKLEKSPQHLATERTKYIEK